MRKEYKQIYFMPGGGSCYEVLTQMVKNFACNAGDLGSVPGLGRSHGEGNGYTPVFLPGEAHGQRSLAGYSPWGSKELDMTEKLTLSLS